METTFVTRVVSARNERTVHIHLESYLCVCVCVCMHDNKPRRHGRPCLALSCHASLSLPFRFRIVSFILTYPIPFPRRTFRGYYRTLNSLF